MHDKQNVGFLHKYYRRKKKYCEHLAINYEIENQLGSKKKEVQIQLSFLEKLRKIQTSSTKKNFISNLNDFNLNDASKMRLDLFVCIFFFL